VDWSAVEQLVVAGWKRRYGVELVVGVVVVVVVLLAVDCR
jgi:hypothetical protein